jgi:mannose-6-phosphate isomerase-like protein (cupin superfamily)
LTGVLLSPGEGQQVGDRPVHIKAGLDQLALTEFRLPAGQGGPPRHIHREHADAFYVLEGEATIELADQVLRAGPGDFVAAPSGVVHTFRNESDAEVGLLNIHAPSMGFHEYMLGRHPDFDQHDPPADGGRPASDGVVRPAGEGESISVGPSTLLFKAESSDTEGTFALTETTVAAGFPGPVPHVHREMVDSFWVLEGELTVLLGEETAQAGPGSYALVPPGTVHTFSNPSDRPVRMLNLMAPGGLEQYLKELAGALPADRPPDPGEMARIASKYDFQPA